jgi:hypothetical protein
VCWHLCQHLYNFVCWHVCQQLYAAGGFYALVVSRDRAAPHPHADTRVTRSPVTWSVGSVRADKQDLDKELVGDFLRNASMRFGIALSLWSKQDWSDNTTIVRTTAVERSIQNHPASQLDEREITPAEVAEIFGGAVVTEAVITPIKAATSAGTISDKQKGLISKLAKEKVDGDVTPILKQQFKKASINELTTKEGSALIKLLMEATVGKLVINDDEEPF